MRRTLTSLLVAGILGAAAPPASGASPVVVRAGTDEITRAQVDRWTRIHRSRDVAGARTTALQQLVGARWVAGEVALRGLTIDEARVRRQARIRIPGDISTRRERLAEMRAVERANALVVHLARVTPQPTPEAVRAFYEEHREEFGEPFERVEQGIRVLLHDRARAAAGAEIARRWRSVTACRPGYAVRALCGDTL